MEEEEEIWRENVENVKGFWGEFKYRWGFSFMERIVEGGWIGDVIWWVMEMWLCILIVYMV